MSRPAVMLLLLVGVSFTHAFRKVKKHQDEPGDSARCLKPGETCARDSWGPAYETQTSLRRRWQRKYTVRPYYEAIFRAKVPCEAKCCTWLDVRFGKGGRDYKRSDTVKRTGPALPENVSEVDVGGKAIYKCPTLPTCLSTGLFQTEDSLPCCSWAPPVVTPNVTWCGCIPWGAGCPDPKEDCRSLCCRDVGEDPDDPTLPSVPDSNGNLICDSYVGGSLR